MSGRNPVRGAMDEGAGGADGGMVYNAAAVAARRRGHDYLRNHQEDDCEPRKPGEAEWRLHHTSKYERQVVTRSDRQNL